MSTSFTLPPQSDSTSAVNAIFKQPLEVKDKERDKVRPQASRQMLKARLILGLSAVALISYAVLFFYPTASSYLKAPQELKKMQAEVKQYEELILPNLESQKQLHKKTYDQQVQQSVKGLETIFPPEVNKLEAVQFLESFASAVALENPPFEFSAINIGKPMVQEDYQVLPLSTTIHSSQAGFEKFLALVQSSGALYEDAEGTKPLAPEQMVRLMSISGISVKYRGVNPQTGKDDGVDFSIKLDVYARLPEK